MVKQPPKQPQTLSNPLPPQVTSSTKHRALTNNVNVNVDGVALTDYVNVNVDVVAYQQHRASTDNGVAYQHYRALAANNVNGVAYQQHLALANNVNEVEYLDSFPPGYRFYPTDCELIVDYLEKKVNNKKLPPNRIYEAEVYNYHPKELTDGFRPNEGKETEWYFFSSRTRKYMNGSRPSRSAGIGYWKATGRDKPIRLVNGNEVGCKKSLVYYDGKPPGNKSHWIMQEYRLKNAPQVDRGPNNDNMKLDNWVLCKIYYKPPKRATSPVQSPPSVDSQMVQSPSQSPPTVETQLVQSPPTVENLLVQSPPTVENGKSETLVVVPLQHARDNMQIVCAGHQDNVEFNGLHHVSSPVEQNGLIPSIKPETTSPNSDDWQSMDTLEYYSEYFHCNDPYLDEDVAFYSLPSTVDSFSPVPAGVVAQVQQPPPDRGLPTLVCSVPNCHCWSSAQAQQPPPDTDTSVVSLANTGVVSASKPRTMIFNN